MPSMPIFFWNDPDGERYREAYFDMYPGVWRHGDWIEITERGTAIISGRSDSTINRGGIRMGTAEIYRAVLALDDVTDALVVDIPMRGRGDWMPLFVVLRDGASLDDELVEGDPRRASARTARRATCRTRSSTVAEVPRTLSGKVLELPVKRILHGRRSGEGGEPRLARQSEGAGLLRRLRRTRLIAPAIPGGSRPSVDSHEPARISSRPAIAPAPGRSPSTAMPSASATTGLT